MVVTVIMMLLSIPHQRRKLVLVVDEGARELWSKKREDEGSL